MRGEDGSRQGAAVLEKALSDDSINVRIAAAQALAQYGDAASLPKALATLESLAAPEANGVLTSMAALAAIEALGSKAASLHAKIAAMKPDGQSPDGRYNSYVPRLMENIVPRTKTKAGKGKGKKKAKPAP
jgi:uncharacterized sulfatase